MSPHPHWVKPMCIQPPALGARGSPIIHQGPWAETGRARGLRYLGGGRCPVPRERSGVGDGDPTQVPVPGGQRCVRGDGGWVMGTCLPQRSR